MGRIIYHNKVLSVVIRTRSFEKKKVSNFWFLVLFRAKKVSMQAYNSLSVLKLSNENFILLKKS